MTSRRLSVRRAGEKCGGPRREPEKDEGRRHDGNFNYENKKSAFSSS
jgi:hypothetical protein